jgi:hypothetical protein
VARFNPARVHFGERPAEDDFEDDGTGIPKPIRAKQTARRMAGIKEAKQVLEHLPGPGESLHAVCTARMDTTDIIAALLDKAGRCERMAIATLGMNQKNVAAMLYWLDTGIVKKLSLVVSIFFRSHKGDLFEYTQSEFRARGQRVAACHSHCKVTALHFQNGTAMSLEGSANLCGNGSGREQIAIFNDAQLCAWHSGWIEDLLSKHEEAQPSHD